MVLVRLIKLRVRQMVSARLIKLHVRHNEEVGDVMLFETLRAHHLGDLAHRLCEVGAHTPVRRRETPHFVHKGGAVIQVVPYRVRRKCEHLVAERGVANLGDEDAERYGHMHRRARHRTRDIGHAHEPREAKRSACTSGHGCVGQDFCRHEQRPSCCRAAACGLADGLGQPLLDHAARDPVHDDAEQDRATLTQN